jgi:hypothetical protein
MILFAEKFRPDLLIIGNNMYRHLENFDLALRTLENKLQVSQQRAIPGPWKIFPTVPFFYEISQN